MGCLSFVFFSQLGNGIQDLSRLMVQPVEFFEEKSGYILLIFNQSSPKQCNFDILYGNLLLLK